MESKIEFEITNEHIPYRYISKLIEKICEEHENKRDLHIKVNLIGNYLEESESLREKSTVEVATAKCKMVTVKGTADGGWAIVEENPPKNL